MEFKKHISFQYEININVIGPNKQKKPSVKRRMADQPSTTNRFYNPKNYEIIAMNYSFVFLTQIKYKFGMWSVIKVTKAGKNL
jgi:hypothetical protein